jgi:hypothetical protein
LEQHRLRGHGEQVLADTNALIGDLLASGILPGMVAALLGSFREDVTLALEAKDATAKQMIA